MVAYLFAGQGSQYLGMGKDLYDNFAQAKTLFDKANQALGFDLVGKCFNGPESMLKLTNIAQPAIFVTSLAAFEVFKSKNLPEAQFYAGLSLGEYSALVAAGSLTFEDGLKLVRRRAEIMNEACLRHPGKMAAVLDLPEDKIREICLKSGAEVANFNCPGQIVISGKKEAVDQAKEMCLLAGAKRVIDLEVSGGFHSSLMFEASMELKLVLDKICVSDPKAPVVSNFSAKPQYRLMEIRKNLIRQMSSSIKWEDSMRYILAQGITKFYEFGPGKVLKGLMRRIEPKAEVINIEKSEDINKF